MNIQVTIKQNYGKQAIYPACELSSLFASMAKQSTLTDREISIIKKLGYTITVIQDVVSL